MSVLEYILQNKSEDRPDVAFVDADNPSRKLTWQDSIDAIRSVARGLANDLHVKQGECVALISRNDIYHGILAVGVATIGGTCVGLPPHSTSAELERYFTACGATWIFTEDEFHETVLDAASRAGIPESRILDFDARAPRKNATGPITFSSLLAIDAGGYEPPSIPSTQGCFRVLTSGTTGWPKAADCTHQAMIARTPNLHASKTVHKALHCTPQYHASSMFMFLATMMGWQTTYISRITEPTSIVDSIHTYQISAMTANPRLTDSIAGVIESGTRPKDFLESLRSYACGGSVVTQKNLATLQAVLPTEASIKLAYGSTEAGIVFAPRPGAKIDYRYVGSLITGTVEVRIVNPDTLQDVTDNEEGELILRGAPVFSGYYNSPESDELSHLIDATGRWYRTGDKVMFDSAREEYRVTGRYKDIFKVFDGKEVSPEEVEDVLKTHESVTDAAVTARPGRRGDGYLEPVAYVVCSRAVDQQELANYVASSLSAYKSPTGGVVVVDQIPRTGFGKVARRELDQIPRASSLEYLAPVVAVNGYYKLQI